MSANSVERRKPVQSIAAGIEVIECQASGGYCLNPRAPGEAPMTHRGAYNITA